MTCYQEITCLQCDSKHITQAGCNVYSEQCCRCQEPDCPTQTFMLKYRYRAYEPDIKEKVIDMAINGSGIRDTGRVLN